MHIENDDNDDDLTRLQWWLEGRADDDLDWLEANFMNDGRHIPHGMEPTWALIDSIATTQDFLDVTWALNAESLLEDIDDLRGDMAHRGMEDMAEIKKKVINICTLSSGLLEQYAVDESRWWRWAIDDVESFSGSIDEFIFGPLSLIDDRLAQVRDTYAPQIDSVAERRRTDD